MKNLPNNKKNLFLAIFTGIVFALAISGCSNDEDSKKTGTSSKVESVFDHTHESEVSDVQKHKFEHDFADQCVQRELTNSIDKDADAEHWKKPCMCIATYLMKDLTAGEAEKFLEENKSTQSLAIKYQAATYHCLESKAVQPKGPNFSAPAH